MYTVATALTNQRPRKSDTHNDTHNDTHIHGHIGALYIDISPPPPFPQPDGGWVDGWVKVENNANSA